VCPTSSGLRNEAAEGEPHRYGSDAPIFLKEWKEGSSKEDRTNANRYSTRQDHVDELCQSVTKLSSPRMIDHIPQMLRSEAVTPPRGASVERSDGLEDISRRDLHGGHIGKGRWSAI
jgi:hypothetical protein